jgi:hypothetical protein
MCAGFTSLGWHSAHVAALLTYEGFRRHVRGGCIGGQRDRSRALTTGGVAHGRSCLIGPHGQQEHLALLIDGRQ